MNDHRDAIRRTLDPRTIAVVGLRDGAPFVPYFAPTLGSGAEIHFVNPKYDTVMGRPAVASLKDIAGPIDAVYCVTGAQVAVGVVEEAATLDVGGVVLVSSGYAEVGDDGVDLQRRLAKAAHSSGMAVVGPNGLGYVNVPRHVSLTIASDHKRRPGGISVVSQSGAVLSGVAMAAWQRPQIGLNVIVSAGNEAVTDLADYVDYLADDPGTTAIGLVIEKIRRPEAFFAAARRAMAAGKPIVALKLARSVRTQEMAASHTGALTGDAWVYDVAFRQLGIGIARDPDELVDRLAVIDQLGPEFRTAVTNLAIITSTGGYASMAGDLAPGEGIEVPALDDLRPWIEGTIRGIHVPNPLDATPMGLAHWTEILERYAARPDVDALLYIHPLADEDGNDHTRVMIRQYAEAAEQAGKPFVISNCAGPPGAWVQEMVDASPAVTAANGPLAALRGLRTLGDFVRRRPAPVAVPPVTAADRPVREVAASPATGASAPAVPRPAAPTVAQPEGAMLPFAAGMELLAAQDIPVAPYHLVPGDAEVTLPEFDGPYVVKLADVAHRTEHGAVELGVVAGSLGDALARMRAVATRDGLSPLVAVQPMLEARGEAMLGVQRTELGPLVVFGLGGILVEVLNKVGGRMAPFARTEAKELIAEFADTKVMHGFRGQPAWDLEALADILVAVGRLAAGASGWLASLDVNPLLVTEDGFVAVDALCLVAPALAEDDVRDDNRDRGTGAGTDGSRAE